MNADKRRAHRSQRLLNMPTETRELLWQRIQKHSLRNLHNLGLRRFVWLKAVIETADQVERMRKCN